MKTYQAVRAEIARLEKQAEDLRRQELKTVIAQVRQAIADYGLTAADLGMGSGRKRAVSAGRRASTKPAKYRDPKTGQTWTGHGRPPAWIAAAKDRNAFLIDAAAAPAKVTKQAKAKPAKAAKAIKPAKSAKSAKPGTKTRSAARAKKPRAAAKSAAVQIESGVAAQ